MRDLLAGVQEDSILSDEQLQQAVIGKKSTARTSQKGFARSRTSAVMGEDAEMEPIQPLARNADGRILPKGSLPKEGVVHDGDSQQESPNSVSGPKTERS